MNTKWAVKKWKIVPVGKSKKTGATKYIEVDDEGKQIGKPFWHIRLRSE